MEVWHVLSVVETEFLYATYQSLVLNDFKYFLDFKHPVVLCNKKPNE
jgi:hypothetical protein